MHAQIGETYWVRHAGDPDEAQWALVPASYWGVTVDPPEPRNLVGAVFTTREKAEAYRAAAKPGTAGARTLPLVRAKWAGDSYFRIVQDTAA